MNKKDEGKKNAAIAAVEFVRSGMVLGLGTGSTASWFLKSLAERIKNEELEVLGVPTSQKTRDEALSLKIPLATLDDVDEIDLVVDGADEFDPNLNLIKGGGGALLQEKIVAKSAKRMLVITDYSKRVPVLGAFPLPIEIVRFGAKSTLRKIQETLINLNYKDFKISWRFNKKDLFLTDEKHFIVDLGLGTIKDARELHRACLLCPGVVETGLFVDFADLVIVGEPDGSCSTVELNLRK